MDPQQTACKHLKQNIERLKSAIMGMGMGMVLNEDEFDQKTLDNIYKFHYCITKIIMPNLPQIVKILPIMNALERDDLKKYKPVLFFLWEKKSYFYDFIIPVILCSSYFNSCSSYNPEIINEVFIKFLQTLNQSIDETARILEVVAT